MRCAIAVGLLLATAVFTGCQQRKGTQVSPLPLETPPGDLVLTEADEVPPPPDEAVQQVPMDRTSASSPPALAPAPAQRIHIVQPGETLWRISGMYYGKASQANVRKITDANPGLNPDKIEIGRKLLIPD
ncbi:MAG: LysM peptidoglycan-binding domain-containing protein [Planctomycetes bacterium]|nr:LysM peptidoglycan-binding domain-containing protein [Planctomycetota bacterium]